MGDAIDGMGLRSLATGHLLDGQQPGTITTWADIKAQSLTKLGIQLNDFDVHNAPLLVTDEYGEFVRGPNGFPLMVMAPDATHPLTWTQEGNPDAPITTARAVLTCHQFLIDIAHHAGPGIVDHYHNPGTPTITQIADFNRIDAIRDDRGNENIALTAAHSVFHARHNRLVEENNLTILETAAGGAVTFLNEWLLA